MAKIQGLVGGLSGKMGNAVFRQRKGQTVVAQYQPIVSNPNTAPQQNARAAFKLITQLSAIMAPAFGSLGVITRPARQGRNPRNAFVAKNYSLISVNPSPEAAEKVTIPMEELQLTDSFRPGPALSNDSEVGALKVSAQSLPADAATVRYVIVEYIAVQGGSQAAIMDIIDNPVTEQRNAINVSVTPGKKLTVLAYALSPSAAAREAVDFDNIHTPSDSDFISAVELDKMVRDGDMTVTMTSGVNVTVPTT